MAEAYSEDWSVSVIDRRTGRAVPMTKLIDMIMQVAFTEAADALAEADVHRGCSGCKGGLEFAIMRLRQMAESAASGDAWKVNDEDHD